MGLDYSEVSAPAYPGDGRTLETPVMVMPNAQGVMAPVTVR